MTIGIYKKSGLYVHQLVGVLVHTLFNPTKCSTNSVILLFKPNL